MEGWMRQREGEQEGFHRQHVTEEWFFKHGSGKGSPAELFCQCRFRSPVPKNFQFGHLCSRQVPLVILTQVGHWPHAE